MSRKSIQNKKQARTDNVIEEFENKLGRSLLSTQISNNNAHKKLHEEANQCKNSHEESRNSGMDSSTAMSLLNTCIRLAIDSYQVTTDMHESNYLNIQNALIQELESTLKHPLYSQDFEAYWR